MLLPLCTALLAGESTWLTYVTSMLITMGAGTAAWLATARSRTELSIKDGFLLVVLVWSFLPLFAALPLMHLIPDLSFTDAFFESVSGFTTTGATVLSGLDQLPLSVNLWRAELHWLGGMGIIVLAVAILPLLGVGGLQLFKAETPGPMKDSRLTPRIAQTAKALWLIYAALTIGCMVCLWLAGMSWGDALIHAFSALSTGGFSSHDASIGYFDSTLIESVLIVFMVLGGLNFGSHFLALRGRSLSAYWNDPEAAAGLGVIVTVSGLIAIYLWMAGSYPDPISALRFAMFNTVSVATTTGFSSTDYGQWPLAAPLLMLLVGSFCTSSGSTGGGIKMVRALLLYHQSKRELTRLLHPEAVTHVKLRGNIVENKIIFSVLAFMFFYSGVTISFIMILVISGLDLSTAISAVVACMNTIGPGLSEIGPAGTYAVLTDFQTWVCSVAMLVGRLELLTVAVLFTSAYWAQ